MPRMSPPRQPAFIRTKSPRVVISRPSEPKSPRVVIPRSDELKSHSVLSSLEASDYARSRDKSWKPRLAVTTERMTLLSLKSEWKNRDHKVLDYDGYPSGKELLIVDLNDFELYTSPKQRRAWELTSLEFLDIQGRELWLDGILSVGKVRHYVQGVPIKSYSVEGYGVDGDPSTVIYIQSQGAFEDDRYDIWYRLRLPSARYKPFHKVFHWLSGLGKHVMDFLEAQPEGVQVGLNAFKEDFCRWLLKRFPKNVVLTTWLAIYESEDFRKSIHAHIDYLRQEAYNLPNRQTLLKQPLWADCMREDHRKIKLQPLSCDKTIATPHTYACFKNRYFAAQLLEQRPSKEVQKATLRRRQQLGFPTGSPQRSAPRFSPCKETCLFQIGDVVCILPDITEQQLWGKSANTTEVKSAKEWYAYVQRIKLMEDGIQQLYVFWLYAPENTTILTTDYPVKNELFMSDHCNCNEGALLSTSVVGRCTIDKFATSFNTKKDFIVRQRFLTEDSSFVTLKEADFECDCKGEKSGILNSCQRGDTVYISQTSGGTKLLDPVVIHALHRDEGEITVRKLYRLKDPFQLPDNTHPSYDNALVWSDELFRVRWDRVQQRKCYVRYFKKDDKVPYPYNRGGAGDFWILSAETLPKADQPQIKYLTASPSILNEGPDFTVAAPFEKLSGLSLFSGLGNLDKGLEQAGAVEFNASVDMCPEAIHTLYANAQHPDKLKLWLGSVDDNLKALLDGKRQDLIAQIGQMDIIAAGSPCPGFSTLQTDWLSPQSIRNASHVTTFCSFVDVYRPKYAFLENVVNMACIRKGYEKELVLSQLIACLVSMGYQVQQFIMNSWNYGSCQSRSRLMLIIAAPGLTPLIPPAYTHGNPDRYRIKSIGELMTGQKYGLQLERLTPFPFVSASQALGHLPNIGNGQVHACAESPDHRLYAPMNEDYRQRIKCVPLEPPGQTLRDAVRLGLVPGYLHESRKDLGAAYRRIKSNGLVPTLTTRPSPHDNRNSACVHWEQHRPITIEEARLIQGIPSHEVIIGSLAEQMRMVGNAVDRRVSEQLGLALRRALESSPLNEAASKGATSSSSMSIVGTIPVVESRGTDFISDTISDNDDDSSNSNQSVICVKEQRRQRFEHVKEQCADEAKLVEEMLLDIPSESERFTTPDDVKTLEEVPVQVSPVNVALPPKSIFSQFSHALACGIGLLQPSVSAPKQLPVTTKRAREITDDEVRPADSSISSKRVRQENDFEPPDFPLKKSRHESESSGPINSRSVTKSHKSRVSVVINSRHSLRRSEVWGPLVSPSSPSIDTPESAPERCEVDMEPLLVSFKAAPKPRVTSKTTPKPTALSDKRSSLRKTRHSGLKAEFVPKSWNKKVEAR